MDGRILDRHAERQADSRTGGWIEEETDTPEQLVSETD